ncbi:MAG: SIMPL domain-containing protein [Treponema sp.]
MNKLFDAYTIEQKHVTIENLTIHPRYAYRSDVPQFLYYEIEQHISVLITRLENYEPFLTALLNNGIDRITDVRFFAQDVKKYKNEAHSAAIQAAEEKALLLCAASESNGKKCTLGKVLRIAEVPLYSYGDSYNAVAQNRIAYAKSADEGMSDAVSAPIGKIRFDARVEMVFELHD